MDFVDIVFSAAKMMKYLEFPQLVTDLMFGLFVVAWFITRQIGLLLITLNVYSESPKYISLHEPEIYPLGPYDLVSSRLFPSSLCFALSRELGWKTRRLTCFVSLVLSSQHYSRTAQRTFYTSLGLLWVLMCVWFVMIGRVAWKVVIGSGAEDTRSDDEEEEEESLEEESDFEEQESEVRPKVAGRKMGDQKKKGEKGGVVVGEKRELRKRK